MSTNLNAHHPYQAGPRPRTLFLVSGLLSVVSVAAAMAGLAGLFRLELATWVTGVCLAVPVYLSSRGFRSRAWVFVPRSDQQGALEPWWVTLVQRGVELALVVVTIGYGVTVGTAWSAGVALGTAGVLTGSLLVRAGRGVRDRVLEPRWWTWRVVDAAVLTLTTAAVVGVLAAQLDATTRTVTGVLLLPTLLTAALGAVSSAIARRFSLAWGYRPAPRAALRQA